MKKKAVFKSILPFLVFFLIQVVVAVAGTSITSMMVVSSSPELASDPVALAAAVQEAYLGKVTTVICLVHVINFIVMILWARKYQKLVPDVPVKQVATPKNILMIILMGIGVQGVVIAILNLVNLVNPSAMDSYSELMQTAGIGQFTVVSFLATVILAPIGEELCFRGISMKILRNAELPMWVVFVLPAFLFGLEHFNVVQSSYAFAMGLLLAYIAYKYKSVVMAIILHVVINLAGTIISECNIGFEGELQNAAVFGVVGAAALVIAFVCFDKKN